VEAVEQVLGVEGVLGHRPILASRRPASNPCLQGGGGVCYGSGSPLTLVRLRQCRNSELGCWGV
jgi:hypothetical protein